MSVILVCPTEHAAAFAREHRPSHVLGLASPDAAPGDLAGHTDHQRRHAEGRPTGASRSTQSGRACFETARAAPPQHDAVGSSRSGFGDECSEISPDHRLALAFHDIAEPQPGLVAPSARDIAAILASGRSWDGSRPLLVHCALGISRSTAAAFALAADRCPQVAEIEIASQLRAAAPCATPNLLMVALADAALGRRGRLVAAAAAIGRGAEYVPQAGFALALGY